MQLHKTLSIEQPHLYADKHLHLLGMGVLAMRNTVQARTRLSYRSNLPMILNTLYFFQG